MTTKGYDVYGEGKGSDPESFDRVLSFTCTTKDNRPYVEVRGWRKDPSLPNSALAIFDARNDHILPMVFAMILKIMEGLPMVYSNNPEDFDRVVPEGANKPDLRDILAGIEKTIVGMQEDGAFKREGFEDTP